MQLPPPLEAELRRLGVGVHKQQPVQQKPVERDFTYKMPVLDENGEPDF